jgi:hypothetical protein
MSFTLEIYWNNFIGFYGPPVTNARFSAVTYNGKTPVFTPLRSTAGGPLGNSYFVERDSPAGNVAYTGNHPDTREERTAVFYATNGRTRTVVL